MDHKKILPPLEKGEIIMNFPTPLLGLWNVRKAIQIILCDKPFRNMT
jgi:hypothetical protein